MGSTGRLCKEDCLETALKGIGGGGEMSMMMKKIFETVIVPPSHSSACCRAVRCCLSFAAFVIKHVVTDRSLSVQEKVEYRYSYFSDSAEANTSVCTTLS